MTWVGWACAWLANGQLLPVRTLGMLHYTWVLCLVVARISHFPVFSHSPIFDGLVMPVPHQCALIWHGPLLVYDKACLFMWLAHVLQLQLSCGMEAIPAFPSGICLVCTAVAWFAVQWGLMYDLVMDHWTVLPRGCRSRVWLRPVL